MSTYREIIGKKIKKVSSDPSDGLDGEMWYNSTTGTLRGPAILEAWSSAAPMVAGKGQSGNFGIQTSAVSAAGSFAPARTDNSYEYNGSGWTTITVYPAALNELAGVGIETAGLVIGGRSPPPAAVTTTTEYNGSSWTGGGALPAGRHSGMAAGTQTAALYAFGRNQTAPAYFKTAYEYDGSSWTAANDASTLRAYLGGFGTQTAGVACGGFVPPQTNVTEEYDGTNWTTTGNMGTARYQFLGTAGTETAGLAFGGRTSAPAYPTQTESYNGSTWSTSPATLATGRGIGGYGQTGTSTAAVGFGGSPPSYVANTEEYNASTNVITAAAWASGNNLNTVRTLGGSAIPTVSDGIVFGGSGYTNVTEQYDGTTWTEKGDLNTARGYIAGFGTSTAAVAAGGYTAPNNPQSLVEEFNGSSWSEETNLPAARKSSGNCGTLTAGLIMGGSTAQPYAANVVNSAFEYDGTSWTATPGSMPEAKGQGMSGGTQTAAYYAAGRIPPNTYTQKTAEYNGSSFSEGGNVVTISETTAQGAQGATGTQTAGLATGGQPAKTNTYDGTAWATSANFNTGRNKGMGGGTATAALIAGGGAATGNTAATEEFTAETTAVNIKTFTTS